MKLIINKNLLSEVVKQIMKDNHQKKLQKQIRYHQKMLDDSISTWQQRKISYYRLKQIRQKWKIDQKDVMPGVKDAGHQLRKQDGLAKSILPFKGPKRITQKKWQKEHLNKKK